MEKEGLSIKEAAERLAKYGFNEIKDVSAISSIKIFLRQIKKNYIIYLLFAAMIISFFVGKSITAYAILGVILLIVVTGFVQEFRAERAVKALKGMISPVSIVIRNSEETEILSREIVPGDILVLRSGEKVPADCVILEEKDLILNESLLTGEAKEVRKTAAKNPDKSSEENTLFMGSFIMNGRVTARVTHTAMNTKFGQIAEMISTAEKELPLQKKINHISKYMALVAIVFSVLTGTIIFLTNPFSESLVVEVLILVIALTVSAFPEGFPVVLITALSSGAYKMAQKNAIVNRMSIIETLGETTVICSDKTGTITKGEMTVRKIFSDNNLFDVSGIGYDSKGSILRSNEQVKLEKEETLRLLIHNSVMCNDSRIERAGEDNSYHTIGAPTEASLLILAAKAGVHKEDLSFQRIEEIPFSSERKIMSVLCKFEKENYVFSKGAPELLIEHCKFIKRYNGVFKLSEQEKLRILKTNKGFASDSLRTLAFAYKTVKSFSKDHFESDLVFLGLVGIDDPPRDEVKQSIILCKRAGIQVKMITGDDKETAIAVSKAIGLSGRVLVGSDLDKISEEELSKIVGEISIFARVRPEHKLKIVKALKLNSEIVTMTGDGVNDAPALKEAHIGVAMGKNGTDVSRSVADLTLKDDNFATIITAIREGRTIFKNIRKFVSYQLSCNYAELLVLFVGALLSPLLGWQVPLLLALQILFMNLVTDDLPAITLSMNPASQDIMEEQPRKKKEILNKSLIIWMLIAAFSMAAITLAAFFVSFNILNQGIDYARSTALLSLILVEIANAYNFRSFRKQVSFKSLARNPYLFYASVISIIATIIIIYSPLNKVFGTVPLTALDWVLSIVPALLIIFIFNFLKWLNEKREFFKLEHF
ncbi:MAG: cation-transporting P-type ATPase [Nanoarchaeota archaeon]|nr:cation-transporting P-type ATPase [Nanoarchaeota archaeon]